MIDLPFVLLKSYKWRRMGRVGGIEMGFGEAVGSFLIGVGGALFTPAQLGELARVVVFKGDRKKALILAFLDKVIDLSGLCFLFLLSMLYLHRRAGMILGMGGLIALITFAIWLKRGTGDGGQETGRRNIRFPVSGLLSPSKFSQFAFRNSKLAFPRSFFFLQLLLSLTCFGMLMLQFWVILLDFSKVRFVDVVVGLPVILVGSMLPVSLSGLGIREMVASLVLPRFGIDQAQAAISSSLLFLINSFIPGTVGIALLGKWEVEAQLTEKRKSGIINSEI